LEQLRSSLKSSTWDLVAAANSKVDDIGADEGLDPRWLSASRHQQNKMNDKTTQQEMWIA
jgi:hypothetical protein